jgi:hypothetical protein
MHSNFLNSRARIAAANGRNSTSKHLRSTSAGGGAQIVPCVPPRSRGLPESSDQYPRILVIINAGTRVIECKDGLQWIIQRRAGGGRDPWRGVSFCRTKEALLRVTGSGRPALLALPDRFQDGTP